MLGELFGELIVKPFFEFVCYWTGKPIIHALSLGRLNVSLLAEPDRKGKRDRRWYSVSFTRNGKRYVQPEAVSIIGLVVWVIIIAAAVLIAWRG